MPGWNTHTFKAELLAEAERQGFPLAGIAPATPAETRAAYEEWIAAGHAGEMSYLTRDPARRTDPNLVWPDAASILVVGMPYRDWEPEPTARHDPKRGQIARYALGDDYHDVLAERLRAVLAWAEARAAELGGPELRGRYYVDTGPLLERDLGAQAGLGWFGKNTCLLDRRHGSYFFLGALLLNVALPPDAPVTAHCGGCERCLHACPTSAFLAPHVLDARRCISYLTIELRGPIPREFRPLIGNWIFGCDICQEVCPWNGDSARPGGRVTLRAQEPRLAPREALRTPELTALLRMTQEEFSATFRRSPVKRTKRRGFLRNVCVALGNSRDPAAVPALAEALSHEEPLVRGHAAWALGELGGELALAALTAAVPEEIEDWVREEIAAALERVKDYPPERDFPLPEGG